ncbi:hypothetical protein BLA18110_05563 [Burkholderia lata]|nr:hypothetical protein BLA18110_05563 [Burkholderia lata]
MTGGETAVKQVYGSRQENFRGRPGGGPTVFTSNLQTIRVTRRGLNAPPGPARPGAQAAAAASSARAAAALRVLPARDGGWQRPQTKP